MRRNRSAGSDCHWRASVLRSATRHLPDRFPRKGRRAILRQETLLHLPRRQRFGRTRRAGSGRDPSGHARHGLADHGDLESHARHVAADARRETEVTQEEMANILAFLYQASSTDKAGDPAAGQKVSTARAACTAMRCARTAQRPAPDLAKVAAAGDRLAWMHAMWNHAQSMIEPVTKELGAWPQFNGVEMNDLVAYVKGAPSAAIQEDAALRGSADHGGKSSRRSASNAIRSVERAARSVPNWVPRMNCRAPPHSSPRCCGITHLRCCSMPARLAGRADATR